MSYRPTLDMRTPGRPLREPLVLPRQRRHHRLFAALQREPATHQEARRDVGGAACRRAPPPPAASPAHASHGLRHRPRVAPGRKTKLAPLLHLRPRRRPLRQQMRGPLPRREVAQDHMRFPQHHRPIRQHRNRAERVERQECGLRGRPVPVPPCLLLEGQAKLLQQSEHLAHVVGVGPAQRFQHGAPLPSGLARRLRHSHLIRNSERPSP